MYMIIMGKYKFGLENMIFPTVKFTIDSILSIIVVLVIDNRNGNIEESIENMIDVKFQNSEMKAWLEKIRQEAPFCLTAWRMFELKKSLILGFVSALILFTVLFVQLTNN